MGKRILTGVQSSNIPHLGNILGAIEPAIKFANEEGTGPSFFFIANLHGLTTQKDPAQMTKVVYETAAAWLACGVDPAQHILYRQSHVPVVCELAWYFNCFTPYPMLANAHAFKEKRGRLSDVNAGLFTYPVLMAADILLYQATHVPVGKDQQQHLEMTRDIAQLLNRKYGDLFQVPEGVMRKGIGMVPGTDGRKMSKSYQNTINIFAPSAKLTQMVMGIKTSNRPIEAPKDPATCPLFQIYGHVAPDDMSQALRLRYLEGGVSFKRVKEELLALIMTRFADERVAFQDYMSNRQQLEETLVRGEERAMAVAHQTLQEVREAMGLRPKRGD